jgi:hypothetical protein
MIKTNTGERLILKRRMIKTNTGETLTLNTLLNRSKNNTVKTKSRRQKNMKRN